MNIVLPPGGALIGLGCDIIETERIRSVLEKHGDRFLKRVFTEEEQAYCNSIKYSHKHYAARWAAKEAVAKAFTTGIGEHLERSRAPALARSLLLFLLASTSSNQVVLGQR